MLRRVASVLTLLTVTAFATAAAPMLLPAPGLFSTITGCPTRSASFAAITRATVSTGVPGG